MLMQPIGRFECAARHPYDAPRQAVLAQDSRGAVVLEAGRNLEQAVQDLDGFDRIWLIYAFHQNDAWKPMVRPPRAPRKMGVFATRAPYRPNPVGLSCVELLSVRGLRIEVGAHDLLDGTPILDIKPYLPYADSFPEASSGWLEEIEVERWELVFSERSSQQLAWLEQQSPLPLRAFLRQQLSEQPFDTARKRVVQTAAAGWEIAYRTWRVDFSVDPAAHQLYIEVIRSGYSTEELAGAEDPYGDKPLHRAFSRASHPESR